MAMTNGRVQTQDVEGTVEAVNRTGLKIGGAWVNVSQFHPVELPPAGAHVRLRLDSKGFIRELERMDQDDRAVEIVLPDQTATRLAVLNTAAVFGASRPDMKSADVLLLAERWLAWVESGNDKAS